MRRVLSRKPKTPEEIILIIRNSSRRFRGCNEGAEVQDDRHEMTPIETAYRFGEPSR